MLISELPNAIPQKTDKIELQRELTSSNNTEIGQLMQLSASENLAPAYDPNAGTYEVGDFVTQNGTLYQCNTAIATPEAFDATKWTAVKVTEITSGASVVQLTQAEYTALSTAEKMNGSIYKLTDKSVMLCLDEEYHPVKELTTAQYEALTTAEQNNGTIYIQTDAETTADDIPYSSGVSVADKLDNVPTFDTLTSSDNNKLLGVSVSGSDIIVGAVGMDSLIKIQNFNFSYTVKANSYVNKTPSDFITIPSGYSILGYSGFSTNTQNVIPCSVDPIDFNSQWAILLKSISNNSESHTFNIRIVFIKTT